MIIRMCVRAPISLISALIMALYISAKMGGIFCIAIVFLTAIIAFILWKTIPIFSRVFQKYDDLNASVQEFKFHKFIYFSFTQKNPGPRPWI